MTHSAPNAPTTANSNPALAARVACWRHDKATDTMIYDCPEPAPDADRDLMGRPPTEPTGPSFLQERLQEMHAVDPARISSKIGCLLRETQRDNAEAITACGIPEELYPAAINVLAGGGSARGFYSSAFVHKYCEKSLEIGVSFTCTYGGVTMEFS
jgi:hypothetical protein